MPYAIVIEKSASNYAAYVPDWPGCAAMGAAIHETGGPPETLRFSAGFMTRHPNFIEKIAILFSARPCENEDADEDHAEVSREPLKSAQGRIQCAGIA